jgi:AraC-like DNA-binding protein
LTAFHYYPPHPPLSLFIESFWIYQGTAVSHLKERRLPDGSMSLIINLYDDLIRLYDQHHPDRFQDYCGIILSGARSEFALLDTASLKEVMGIQFKPGGTFPFLPFPASELHNDLLSLDVVWGAEAFFLREQLRCADTLARRFQIMEQFLSVRLACSRSIHPAINFALNAFEVSSLPTLSSVIAQVGLGRTRFIHLFREAVGLTPKQFCRIRRFQHILRSVEKGESETWTDLALNCGYYDQAHFIHDFQAFSGLTPGAYLTQRSRYRNHVPFAE